jgi:hypothetical protein
LKCSPHSLASFATSRTIPYGTNKKYKLIYYSRYTISESIHIIIRK